MKENTSTRGGVFNNSDTFSRLEKGKRCGVRERGGERWRRGGKGGEGGTFELQRRTVLSQEVERIYSFEEDLGGRRK